MKSRAAAAANAVACGTPSRTSRELGCAGNATWNSGVVATKDGAFAFNASGLLPLMHPCTPLMCNVHRTSTASDDLVGSAAVDEVMVGPFGKIWELEIRGGLSVVQEVSMDTGATSPLASAQRARAVGNVVGVLSFQVDCIPRVNIQIQRSELAGQQMLTINEDLLRRVCGVAVGATDGAAAEAGKKVVDAVDGEEAVSVFDASFQTQWQLITQRIIDDREKRDSAMGPDPLHMCEKV